MTLSKPCEQCGRTFEKPYYCGIPEWGRRRFCSRDCKSASQIGKPTWSKGKKFPGLPKHYIACRICGEPTKYHGTEKSPTNGQVTCGKPECVAESRRIKNERISARAKADYASGKRKRIKHGWLGVKRVTDAELAISPWMESLGFLPQFKFNTGVSDVNLPRQFSLDFAAPDELLNVEIDGSIHRLRKARDARRDAMMIERGWRVLRVPADLVTADQLAAQSLILDWLSQHR